MGRGWQLGGCWWEVAGEKVAKTRRREGTKEYGLGAGRRGAVSAPYRGLG
jgi:hypothetical protein